MPEKRVISFSDELSEENLSAHDFLEEAYVGAVVGAISQKQGALGKVFMDQTKRFQL